MRLNRIYGAGPAALAIAKMLLRRGESVHIVANYLPTGEKTLTAVDPTYLWAAGIQQPFGGSDPNDIRLRLYMKSHPSMMENARSLSCQAVRECNLKTIVPDTYTTPDWSSIVGEYSLDGNIESYTTAAFDPPGLMMFQWEQLIKNFPNSFTYECRDFTQDEIDAMRKRKPVSNDRTFLCGGLQGSRTVFGDGSFPILGVLLHFEGDESTQCWMDEQPPVGNTGKLSEANCFYLIRRPRYLGDGKFDPKGRIVLGGTFKPNVWRLEKDDLEAVTKAILNGCASRFGEDFSQKPIIQISQCQRPGHINGFQIIVNEDGSFYAVLGQAGMGIVSAEGLAQEIKEQLPY